MCIRDSGKEEPQPPSPLGAAHMATLRSLPKSPGPTCGARPTPGRPPRVSLHAAPRRRVQGDPR
eukprot:11996898-Alexandrium_andersonii.AAC.1